MLNGPAPEGFLPQMHKFRTRKIPKRSPGGEEDRQQRLELPPALVTLGDLAEAGRGVAREDAHEGVEQHHGLQEAAAARGREQSHMAKNNVTTDLSNTCMPEPTDTATNVEWYGLRKTSPCTSFQSVSRGPP